MIATVNKYTVIKASPSDFGFQPNDNIILSHIPDFIKMKHPQEGAKDSTISTPDIVAHHSYLDTFLTLNDDVIYLRRSVRNLHSHQPLEVSVFKARTGIIVQKSFQIDKNKTIAAFMNEVENILDY
jgi:hypothetical protein